MNVIINENIEFDLNRQEENIKELLINWKSVEIAIEILSNIKEYDISLINIKLLNWLLEKISWIYDLKNVIELQYVLWKIQGYIENIKEKEYYWYNNYVNYEYEYEYDVNLFYENNSEIFQLIKSYISSYNSYISIFELFECVIENNLNNFIFNNKW